MADSHIEVTEGTGKRVDTKTLDNGDHRQSVVIGNATDSNNTAPVDGTYGLGVDVKRSALPTGAATSAKQDTIISHVDGIEGTLTTISGKVTKADTDNVIVTSSVLPTGAATSDKQDTIISHVDGIETTLSSIDGNITKADTDNVTVTSSALPTGAATEAKQDTGNTSLSTLAGTVDAGSVKTKLSAELPAGSQLIGRAAASNETSTVYNGTTALTPKYAKANIAASTTDGSVVAAVTSKKIRVLSFRIHAGGTATNVTFNTKPAGAGTAISELFACAANGGRAEAYSPIGHFETNAGEGLTVTTGAGSTVGIGISYIEV